MSVEYPDRPRVAVGGVVFPDGQVLLVRRNKPPSLGEWAIPGGSVEIGETLQEAAAREVFEETGVTIKAGEICHVFEDVRRDPDGKVRFHYVIVDLIGEYLEGEPHPATDVSEAAWVKPEETSGLNVNQNTLKLLAKLKFLA